MIPTLRPAPFLLLLLAVAPSAHAQDEPPAPIPLAPASRLGKAELAIWNDPAFKRQFAESYLAETDIEPRVTEEERQRMQEILELIAADKMDEAARQIEKELTRNAAASAVFDFTLANIYFQREELDRAVPGYEAAVQKFPKFRRAWKNLGLIHIRQGDHAKALPALTRVIELGGADALTYGLLGFACSSTENPVAAESAYRMAIMLDPATLDWKMGLARSFFRQERFAEASALCRKLIESNPDQADLWLLQANAHIGLGQPLEAAQVYELVDQMGKSTADSLNMLGDIYINQELYDVAAETYIRAIDKSPAPDRALRSAKILVARGAFSETRLLADKLDSLKLARDQRKELLKIRARLAVAEGSGDEEVSVLEEIIQLDPLDGEALLLLGQHAARNGDNEKAIFYYERAAAIEAFEPDAKVRQAQILVAQGKYDEALPLLRRAQQVKPRDNVQQYLDQVERVARTR